MNFWNQVTPGHVATFVAGLIAVIVGVVDQWFFHADFGTSVDVALLWGGLGLIGGTTISAGSTVVAAVRKAP